MLQNIRPYVRRRVSALRERAAARKRRISRNLECRRLRRLRDRTAPQYHHCKNCGTELQGMYCHKCGQYALDIRQPFWKYVVQYFENVYQFDGKVWTTLWLLVRRPGFLTREFNSGKIASYVHPMRLLMFISVVFFVFFFPMLNAKIDEMMQHSDRVGEKVALREMTVSGMKLHDDDRWNVIVELLSDSAMVASHPSLLRIEECRPAVGESGQRTDTLTVKIPVELLDRNVYTEVERRDGLRLLQFNPAYVSATEVRLTLFRERIIGFLSGYAAMIVLFFIPVLALLLRFFYRRSKMMYMGHLVFSLHFVSFLFLLLSLLLLVGEWWQYHAVSFWIFLLLVFLYFDIASHEVYKGAGWFKTSRRTVWVLLLYAFVVALALAAIVLTVSFHEKQLLYGAFEHLDIPVDVDVVLDDVK